MLLELEDLKDQKLAMEKEEKNIELEQKKTPNMKDKMIQETKVEIEKIDEKIQKVEANHKDIREEFEFVKSSLSSLLGILKSTENKTEVSITEENLENCLGEIEKKTNFIMKLVKDGNLEEILVDSGSSKLKPHKRNQDFKSEELKGFEDFLSKSNKAPKHF